MRRQIGEKQVVIGIPQEIADAIIRFKRNANGVRNPCYESMREAADDSKHKHEEEYMRYEEEQSSLKRQIIGHLPEPSPAGSAMMLKYSCITDGTQSSSWSCWFGIHLKRESVIIKGFV